MGGSSATAILLFLSDSPFPPSGTHGLLPHSRAMGNSENCNKPAFQQSLILTISPLRRGGYLKTNLYTGARRHQGSPPSKAAEEVVVWAKSTCLDKVVERERVPASSPRQTLLSPAMALLLDLHPVLCWLHPFTGQVNSIIHQETESAGGEGMRGISAGLTELNSAQKRLAQVIGRKQKIFRRKGG